MDNQTDLPSLRGTARLGDKKTDDHSHWYDVKFYPYTPPDCPPVFAAVGESNTVICRCNPEAHSGFDYLRWFRDDEEAELNSVEWSQDDDGNPLVLVTGKDHRIKVLNVKSGELVATLIGHGDAVNDLAISPADHRILATASSDQTVRIFHLDKKYGKQPTAAILHGDSHKEAVLALGFHRNGRYLLTGAMDIAINLWVVPELPDKDTGTDHPTMVHYPHFSSTDVHTDFVDCVCFYNDLIISRASEENKILLWRIDGFNSSAPIPPDPSVPTPAYQDPEFPRGTRSVWGGRFQRLLQFEQRESKFFYMRLGLFHEHNKHPILAAGNTQSRLFFWDLQKLEETGAFDTGPALKKKGKERDQTASSSTVPLTHLSRIREASVASNDSSAAPSIAYSFPSVENVTLHHHQYPSRSTASNAATKSGTNSASTTTATTKKTTAKPKEKAPKPTTGIGDQFRSLAAHKSVMVPKVSFMVRQIAWSRGGEWCVAVGDNAMITAFQRWEGVSQGNGEVDGEEK